LTLLQLPSDLRPALGLERGLACPWPRPSPGDLELMRHGTYGLVDGIEVIGWYGIAKRLGFRTRKGGVAEQSARSMPGRAPGFPGPMFVVPAGGTIEVVLCDWPAVQQFSIRTGRLAPDGVTPLRLRPRRGRAKHRRRTAHA